MRHRSPISVFLIIIMISVPVGQASSVHTTELSTVAVGIGDGTSPMALPIASAGPFGPTEVLKAFDSGKITGDWGDFQAYGDLDGDGSLDLVFCIDNLNGTYNVSAVDVSARAWLWRNWTAPSFPAGFGVMDFDGDGASEVYWRTMTEFYVIGGRNGTLLWNRPLSVMCEYGFGDVDADGNIEAVLCNRAGWNVYFYSVNGSSGAVEWTSGAVSGGYAPHPAQLDADAQEELAIVYSNTTDQGVVVIDAVSNTTQWRKDYATALGPMIEVDDFNGSGMDQVMVRLASSPPRLTLFGTGGTQLWTNNSYTGQALVDRYFDADGDRTLEFVSQDWMNSELEVIDGSTGWSQGYYYCTTYPVSWAFKADPDDPSNGDFVGMSTWPNDAVILFNGTNMSIVHSYLFADMPMANTDDVDGDGRAEFIARTSNGAGSGGMYVYNYTNFQLEWSDASAGSGSYMVMGPVRGLMDGTSKVWDIVTLKATGPGQPSYIAWYDGFNGSMVNSTVTYPSPWLSIMDAETDGAAEVLFATTDAGHNTTLYILKADQPPRVNATIPVLQVNEDSTVTHALDLDLLFTDDRLSGALGYSVVPPMGTAHVTGTIDGGHWLNITASVLDWYGNTTVNVTGDDHVHAPVMATIPVKVLPVNDAPTLEPVADKTFTQGEDARFNVTGHDVEGDALSFFDNTTLFTIDRFTGNVSFVPGEGDVGAYAVNVTVFDTAGLNASVLFNVTILNVNDPPKIMTVPSTTATEDVLYNVNFTAQDSDLPHGDALTWSMKVKSNGTSRPPGWLTINATSGKVSGIPTNGEVGRWDVTVTVLDIAEAVDSLTYTLDVQNVNDLPVFVDVPPAETPAIFKKEFVFDVNATDVDAEDVLTYHITTAPATNMTIDTNTGLLRFVPSRRTELHYTVTLTVSDTHAMVNYEFNVTVTISNAPPTATLASPANGTTIRTTNPALSWTYSDAEGDNVTFAVYLSRDRSAVESHLDSAMTMGATIDTVFRAPKELDKGTTYHWTVVPSDEYAHGICTSGIWSFNITANATKNEPPKFISIPTTEAGVDKLWTYTIHAIDPDIDDIVTVALTSGPDGMELTNEILTWTPTAAQIGDHAVMLQASDGKDFTFQTFEINVTKEGPTNHLPVVSPMGHQTVKADGNLSVQLKVSDEDGDPISFQLVDGPLGITVGPTGLVTWRPTKDDVGNYTVMISVSDGRSTVIASFDLTVEGEGGGGGGGGGGDGDGQKGGTSNNGLWFMLMALMLVIAALVILVAVMRKRGKVTGNEKDESGGDGGNYDEEKKKEKKEENVEEKKEGGEEKDEEKKGDDGIKEGTGGNEE